MKECSKSIPRRIHDPDFMNRYFAGNGIDIGGKPDPLALYHELFPRMRSVRTWDWEDGNAQHLAGVGDESLDFVHSSHCLEHLADPHEGLANWFRVLRPSGHMIVIVPDEDLYEQGVFPSTFNRDHKWTFTIHKPQSWSDRSINVLELLVALGPTAQILKVQLLDASYRYSLPRFRPDLDASRRMRHRVRRAQASPGRVNCSWTISRYLTTRTQRPAASQSVSRRPLIPEGGESVASSVRERFGCLTNTRCRQSHTHRGCWFDRGHRYVSVWPVAERTYRPFATCTAAMC